MKFRPVHILAFSLCLPQMVSAHDPGLSTLAVTLQNGRIEAVAIFAGKDIHAFLDSSDKHELEEGRLQELAPEILSIEQNGQKLRSTISTARFDALNNVEFRVGYDASSGATIRLESTFLKQLPLGHRQLFSARDHAGRKIVERLLSANDSAVVMDMPSAEAFEEPAHSRTAFASFVSLGVKHILTGYDHLLFLFALLMVTRSVSSSLKIITCFTLAHSITLAVATFNVVHLPSRLTEPLIAASIVYVGLENIIRRDEPQRRWLLTFVFGLIHGFGFASVLQEMGVGEGGGRVLLPLFSFNLGVELGQIVIAGLFLPLIWKVKTQPLFMQRLSSVCSMLVALAGGFWFVQRVLG